MEPERASRDAAPPGAGGASGSVAGHAAGSESVRLAEILESHDVACARCGYNLRGLDPRGRCPECGTRVDRSVAPPLLERVDPRWVRRTARGAVLVGVGLGVWVGAVCALAAGALGIAVLLWLGMLAAWRAPVGAMLVLGVAGFGAGTVLVLAGGLLASTGERTLDGVSSVRLWRHGAHLALGAWGATIVLGGLALVGAGLWGMAERALLLGVDMYLIACALGAVVVLAVMVGHLGELLTHVPDAGLARRNARRARRIVAGVLVAVLGFQMANTLAIALGDLMQGLAWAGAAIGGAGATLMGGWLALGIVATGRRVGRCARTPGGSDVDPGTGGA